MNEGTFQRMNFIMPIPCKSSGSLLWTNALRLLTEVLREALTEKMDFDFGISLRMRKNSGSVIVEWSGCLYQPPNLCYLVSPKFPSYLSITLYFFSIITMVVYNCIRAPWVYDCCKPEKSDPHSAGTLECP